MPNSSSASNIEVDINQIATDLNGKADKDLSNTSPVSSFSTLLDNADIRTVVETYHSGTEWYRIWSDGWCEQGGQFIGSNVNTTITLLKAFTDTNYTVTTSAYYINDTYDDSWTTNVQINTISTTSFNIRVSNSGKGAYWEAKGYIS